MDQWIQFAEDRWYLIVAALVVLFIVTRIVKTVVKWVIILAVLAVLVVYGANYKDKLQSIGASVTDTISSEVKDGALKALASEAKEAKFEANADGSFTVTTKSLKIEGKPGENDVTVTFLGQTFHLKADAAVKAFIEQAKANSGA
jgi:outer membrane murein-binding lipoprotein Lpp